MTWVPPTYDDFILRFPEFVTYSEELVQLILDDSNMRVAEGSWTDHDKTPASMNLTAHRLYMTPGAAGAGEDGGGGGGSTVLLGAVKSRTVGDVRVEYETGSSPQSSGGGGSVSGSDVLAEFRATPYGRHYLYLMKLNFPAVAVVYR